MIPIPAIDLRDGAVIRLRQGDFARSQAYAADPVTLAATYQRHGADWLHVVDLDGAKAGRVSQSQLIAPLRASGLRLQWGGGVRSIDDVSRLLDAGVDRVVVGSVAVREPARFARWLDRLGADRLVLALDVQRTAQGWQPALDAWQSLADMDIRPLLDVFVDAGLRHVLCTDIDRDGMANGPNLPLYRELATSFPDLSWIASGGVRNMDDLRSLASSGAAACVIGRALLDGTLPPTALAAPVDAVSPSEAA